jgi:hypothetical protein
MLRYKLRTLLVVLALGPVVLAGAWWYRWSIGVPEVATMAFVVYATWLGYRGISLNAQT